MIKNESIKNKTLIGKAIDNNTEAREEVVGNETVEEISKENISSETEVTENISGEDKETELNKTNKANISIE